MWLYFIERKKSSEFKTLKTQNIEVKYVLDNDEQITEESMKTLFSAYKLDKHWIEFKPQLKDEIRLVTKVNDNMPMFIFEKLITILMNKINLIVIYYSELYKKGQPLSSL